MYEAVPEMPVSNPPGCTHQTLQGLPVLGRAAVVPYSYAASQDVFSGAPIECDRDGCQGTPLSPFFGACGDIFRASPSVMCGSLTRGCPQ